MAIYTVLAPKARDGENARDVDPMAIVFVKEGVSWPALFVAGPWLIYRRMWLVLAAYLVLAIGVSAIGRQFGGSIPGIILIAIHLLFALEANELRRWTLLRRGYAFLGVTEGRGLEAAEIRYFASLEAPATELPDSPPPPAPRKFGPVQPSAEAGDVVGLFPAPGAAS